MDYEIKAMSGGRPAISVRIKQLILIQIVKTAIRHGTPKDAAKNDRNNAPNILDLIACAPLRTALPNKCHLYTSLRDARGTRIFKSLYYFASIAMYDQRAGSFRLELKTPQEARLQRRYAWGDRLIASNGRSTHDADYPHTRNKQKTGEIKCLT